MQKAEPLVIDYFLEVNYDIRYNVVVVTANDEALGYLQEILQNLIESRVSGHHYHIDKVDILEGNIKDLILVRK